MNFRNLVILFNLTLLLPTIPLAKECSSGASCEFYINKQWELIYSGDNRSDGSSRSAEIKIGGASMRGAYVMRRGGQYFIVKESDSNDKSFVIVNIEKTGDRIVFSRVIYFALEMLASSRRGYNVWSANEVSLRSPLEFSKFSWDTVESWQDNFKPKKHLPV